MIRAYKMTDNKLEYWGQWVSKRAQALLLFFKAGRLSTGARLTYMSYESRTIRLFLSYPWWIYFPAM